MQTGLTLTDRERKEFLKRPLSKALMGIELFMDHVHTTEAEMQFTSDTCDFVITAVKKTTSTGQESNYEKR